MLNEVENHIRDAIRQTRSLTYEYSPRVLDDAGLFPALEWLASAYAGKTGLRIVTNLEPVGGRAMPKEIRRLLFDATKECIFNTWKHAEASFVRISGFQPDPDHVSVRVEDDGNGFEVRSLDEESTGDDGFGLFHIQQSVSHFHGEFRCNSKPGIGTAVRITLPLTPQPKE